MRQITPPASAAPELLQVVQQANVIIAEMMAQISRPPRIAKADLPGVRKVTEGAPRIAFVPDEIGGPTLAFFDGADWRRTTDNAVVS